MPFLVQEDPLSLNTCALQCFKPPAKSAVRASVPYHSYLKTEQNSRTTEILKVYGGAQPCATQGSQFKTPCL